MHSYHIHNEHQSITRIIERILKGETMALVSDAGTPAVSDPGFLLVRECIKYGITIECLPGPTAFVPALVNSGLPSDRFTFEGFLPHKKGRQTRMQNLVNEDRTMIFYESPHRLIKALQQFAEYFGVDRQACVSRELTKIYEENVRGTIQEIITYFSEKTIKGEIVIIVAGKADEKKKSSDYSDQD
jgi:16S rRNA (cytidine1402-2'-O)-methyltransferase